MMQLQVGSWVTFVFISCIVGQGPPRHTPSVRLKYPAPNITYAKVVNPFEIEVFSTNWRFLKRVLLQVDESGVATSMPSPEIDFFVDPVHLWDGEHSIEVTIVDHSDHVLTKQLFFFIIMQPSVSISSFQVDNGSIDVKFETMWCKLGTVQRGAVGAASIWIDGMYAGTTTETHVRVNRVLHNESGQWLSLSSLAPGRKTLVVQLNSASRDILKARDEVNFTWISQRESEDASHLVCAERTNSSGMAFGESQPIIFLGLPKVATHSITHGLRSAGLRVAHIGVPGAEDQANIVASMQQARIEGKELLAYLAPHSDAIVHPHSHKEVVDMALLSMLLQQYPRASFVLNHREPQAHAASLARWQMSHAGDRTPLQTWAAHGGHGMPGAVRTGATGEELREWVRWIEEYNDGVRRILSSPSARCARFLEVDVGKDPSRALAEFLNVSKFEWLHLNAGKSRQMVAAQSHAPQPTLLAVNANDSSQVWPHHPAMQQMQTRLSSQSYAFDPHALRDFSGLRLPFCQVCQLHPHSEGTAHGLVIGWGRDRLECGEAQGTRRDGHSAVSASERAGGERGWGGRLWGRSMESACAGHALMLERGASLARPEVPLIDADSIFMAHVLETVLGRSQQERFRLALVGAWGDAVGLRALALLRSRGEEVQGEVLMVEEAGAKCDAIQALAEANDLTGNMTLLCTEANAEVVGGWLQLRGGADGVVLDMGGWEVAFARRLRPLLGRFARRVLIRTHARPSHRATILLERPSPPAAHDSHAAVQDIFEGWDAVWELPPTDAAVLTPYGPLSDPQHGQWVLHNPQFSADTVLPARHADESGPSRRDGDNDVDSMTSTAADDVWRQKRVQCNLVFIRIPGAASSTCKGITHNIARIHNVSGVFEEIRTDATPELFGLCRLWAEPFNAPELTPILVDAQGRRLDSTFLFSFVRDPGARALGGFFRGKDGRFQAANEDAQVIRHLSTQTTVLSDFLVYRRHPEAESAESESELVTWARRVLGGYDFVGVVERLVESLVMLKHILQLDVADLLFFSAKLSGSDSSMLTPLGSPAVQHFLSTDFRVLAARDYAILAEANAKLDRSIAALGRERFEREVAEFEALLAGARVACALSRTSDCLVNQLGCSQPCFQQFVMMQRRRL